MKPTEKREHMSKITQTQFANGVPPKERNGFYGLEPTLIDDPTQTVVVVATYKIAEVTDKHLADEVYPTVALQTIEPLRTADAIAAALKLRDEARFERSGPELPIDDKSPEEPEPDFDTPLASKPIDEPTDEVAAKRVKK